MLREGHSNKQTEQDLQIGEGIVKAGVFRRLDARYRNEAAIFGDRLDI
jgi:DNA-binding NarL/FixJ family response regulator